MDYIVLWDFLSAVKLVFLSMQNMSILFFYCDSVVLEILTDTLTADYIQLLKTPYIQLHYCKPLTFNAVT